MSSKGASIEELARTYVGAASSHALEKLRDAAAANQAHDLLVDTFHQLSAHGDAGWAAIRGLAGHQQAEVRLWAATHLLQREPTAACAVLEALSALPGIIGFEAGIVVSEWRAGRLRWA